LIKKLYVRKAKQRLKNTSTSNSGHETGSVVVETEHDEARALLNKETDTILTEEKEVESEKPLSVTSSSTSQPPLPPPPTTTTATPMTATTTTTTATSSSSSAAIEKNTEINHCINGYQAVGNNINVTVHMPPGGDLINTDTGLGDKENKNAQNDGQEPEKSPTKNTTVTEESQETVEAFQETQGTRLSKAAETEENAPLNDHDYARQEPNLVGYKDRAFVATGSRCKTPNCPIN
jgi:hypothetical protein